MGLAADRLISQRAGLAASSLGSKVLIGVLLPSAQEEARNYLDRVEMGFTPVKDDKKNIDKKSAALTRGKKMPGKA